MQSKAPYCGKRAEILGEELKNRARGLIFMCCGTPKGGAGNELAGVPVSADPR